MTDTRDSTAISPREPAYEAVRTYIRFLGEDMPTSTVVRNAFIWHAVNAALDAMEPAEGTA
ncbi:hypothetical protein ACFQ0G_53860 [Streptomyces chiangmaiensis]|uniref:hypothetical protein n=1 Tax=Streptomyces chiangmaiensis TaxID=766497 RepID=UPI0031EDA8AF